MIKRELECIIEKRVIYDHNTYSSSVSIKDESIVDMCNTRPSHGEEYEDKACEISYDNGIIRRTGGDNPSNILVRNSLKSNLGKKASSKAELLEMFKRYLGNLSQSNRSNFQMGFPSVGVHPTNQSIFKKISVEYLRCKSVREIIDHKYRNVVVEKAILQHNNVTSRNPLDLLDVDSFGDLCSSKSDENGLEFSFFLNSSPDKTHENEDVEQPGKINLETSFDKFLNERSRKGDVMT